MARLPIKRSILCIIDDDDLPLIWEAVNFVVDQKYGKLPQYNPLTADLEFHDLPDLEHYRFAEPNEAEATLKAHDVKHWLRINAEFVDYTIRHASEQAILITCKAREMHDDAKFHFTINDVFVVRGERPDDFKFGDINRVKQP